MRINQITQNYSNLSSRFLKNKIFLKSLEKISEHGISFSAGLSLLMSTVVRPCAIFATPDVEKENKQYACANSICSGLVKFAMVEAVALPVENAVRKLDSNPEKYFNPSTVKNLTQNTQSFNMRSYKLITQIIKLGTGFVTAVPKSILTLSLIPVLMDKIFFKPKKSSKIPPEDLKNKDINFTGNFADKLPKMIANIVENEKIQKWANKHQAQDKDIAKHIISATDVLLTSSFVYQTNRSKKIKENRKKALIYNNVISTAITILGGYAIDNLIKKRTGKFIEKFKQINAGNPKLPKYVEGLNILRPALIFAGIYYCILPIFSTYTAEKVDKFILNHSKKTAN